MFVSLPSSLLLIQESWVSWVDNLYISKVYYNLKRLHDVYSKDWTKVSPDVLCISFLITRQVLVPRSHNTGNPEWRLSQTERDAVCPVLHLHFENKLCPSCPVDAASRLREKLPLLKLLLWGKALASKTQLQVGLEAWSPWRHSTGTDRFGARMQRVDTDYVFVGWMTA